MSCVTCEQSTNKYKCSKCTAPYCSLNCYKSHQSSDTCARPATQQQQANVGCVDEEPTIHLPFSTEDTVSLARLQQLADCEPLRQLLYNPHLRALLQQIDVAHNANTAMTAAMQEPLFIEFANACLQVVEPTTEAERAEFELCS